MTSLQEWQDEARRIPDEINDLWAGIMNDSGNKLSDYGVSLITNELWARLYKKLDVAENPPPAIRKVVEEKMRPPQIANINRGDPMSEERANKGNANPNFYVGNGDEYRRNCQTCVVAYELRRRGYDVSALPRLNNVAMDSLAKDATLAWIEPNTGEVPARKNDLSVTTPTKAYNWLKKELQIGGRYTMGFSWKNPQGGLPDSGHIVHVRKDSAGEIEIYDSQSGMIAARGKDEIKMYFSDVALTVKYKGQLCPLGIRTMRVDTLMPNVQFVNNILTKGV